MTINSPAKKLSVQSPASAKSFQLVANNKLSGRVNDEILLLHSARFIGVSISDPETWAEGVGVYVSG